jgi:hypothetical protein
MKKVWFVSTGEYSDYRVRYVCPTEEAADEVAACIHGTYVQEGTWCESADDLRANRKFQLTINVAFSCDGERRWREHYNDVVNDQELWSHAYPWSKSFGGSVVVSGTDYDRVRKVASEMAAKYESELNDSVDFAAIRAEAAECRELEARIAKVRASTV